LWWHCGTSEAQAPRLLALLSTSDNRYYVKLNRITIFAPFCDSLLLLNRLFVAKNGLKIRAKSLQSGDPLGRGLDQFLFMNEDLSAFPLHQRAQAFAHTPT